MKATIYDVAHDSGVGISTVSRVLNNSPNVSPKTKEKVLASIEKMNFYPNANARGLTSAKTSTIGIAVPFYLRYFFMDILVGVGDELASHGYDIILFNIKSPDDIKNVLRKIIGESKISGLIGISISFNDEEIKNLDDAGIPVVLVDSSNDNVSSIFINNINGGYKAVKHLVELGHTKIATIIGSHTDPFKLNITKSRLKGMKRALKENDIHFEPNYVRHGNWNKYSAYEAMEVLLSLHEPPTAVFCCSDIMALGAIEKVKKRGLRIPEDIAIVGYDDLEFSSLIGLTTLRQPLDILGEMSTKIIMSNISEGKYRKQKIEIEPELIIRNSTVKEEVGN